ncbi:cytochrome c biogenesis protein [Parabacteroides sp. FAFU027]|uniref:cytochrome c biogenesis protein n=1 Tax=Parabacteroides sp. FAFU027 TaxID=2922715 RepID=UPI001FAFF817|nr:cytochrome c biogenesis protein CcsA [Parabacteroides sp. FAFU027]
MKKLIHILTSIRASIVMMVIFAVAIGYATFVENSQGTPTARSMVYNALWVEVLLTLLTINMVIVIHRTKLIPKKKWGVLLFHVAFICILAGAAITRFFGYEGIMHIRQGETSNTIATDKTVVTIKAEYNGQKAEKSTEVDFGETKDNTFNESLQVGGKSIEVENTLFVPNAREMIEADTQGEPAVSLFIMSGAEQSMDVTLFGNEKNDIGGVTFGFEGKDSADVLFSTKDNVLYFKSKETITKTGTMASGMIDRKNAVPVTPGELCQGEENTVYRVGKIVFMIKGFMPKAAKTLTQASASEGEMNMDVDALTLAVKEGNSTKKINVFKDESDKPISSSCLINGVKVSVSYGKMSRILPFSLTLRAFQLDRYPGSMSPSSYASEITLKDTERKSVRPYRIFMNNILNYRGYRFFQSSYDEDEQGTILSVNHDYWGTFVTYIGYLMLVIGMGMTLFNKRSRFQKLIRMADELQQKRKVITILALLITVSTFAANNSSVSKAEHLKAFSRLLVQDGAEGRIEPISTYSSDILRKIYKKNAYKGQSPEEVLLGMITNPKDWKKEPIIKVNHDQLAKELGAKDGHISYNQLFDTKTGSYKLSGIVDKAYIKDQSKRNTYEKEVVYLDERFNICSQIFDGSLLALFPEKSATNGKWSAAKQTGMTTSGSANGCPYCAKNKTSHAGTGSDNGMKMPPADEDIPSDASSETDGGMNPHIGMGNMSMPDPSMGACTRNQKTPMSMFASPTAPAPENSPEGLLGTYIKAVNGAAKSGNWRAASDALAKIEKYQQQNSSITLPSAAQVKTEILYNEWDLFNNLAYIYFTVGAILLGLHLLNIFKYRKGVQKVLDFSYYPLVALFVVYTAGMGLRWYISGHAPWSNGYESMLFVGWAASLSGLLFARKSPMAFSVTALLSATALIVAAMSWMNPEITNLVPVLKSYWLVVHVAVITSSYGFFAMAMLLGLVNMILMIAKKENNQERLNDNIKELSYIIEMAMIIGLFLLTIGNFLGAVWANESWGRYWGWDAKETWALVSILVYAVILHVRMIPGGNHPYILSALSVIGFGTVIMTFLGVNYYLSGMHSYGKGTPPPMPDALFIFALAVIAIIVLAFMAERKNNFLFASRPVNDKEIKE